MFPGNFSEEHFYWVANAGTTATQGGTGLVLALEGAFAVGPAIAGDQIVFGRVRIRMASVPVSGDYKVYTPFGDFDFPGLTQGARLFFTSDIGIGCGTAFDCALNSAIGPFLLPSATSGGPEMGPVTAATPNPGGLAAPTPYPGTGKSYIADPTRVGPVTGSPLPPFVSAVDGLTYDHNRFRIEGPGGYVMDEPTFTLGGRVMTNTIPGRVSVNRASYAVSPTAANKLDVFATAFPTTQGRLPAGTVPPAANPDLGFYDAPCTTDPITGALSAPQAAVGLPPFLYYQMLKSGNNWWGGNAPVVIPPQVCVQDLNARDAFGNVKPAFFLGDVTDEVDITVRNWDPTINGGTLTVVATSSDQVNAPALTLAGFGPLVGGQHQVSNLAGPPAKVVVVSTRGGVAELDVRTGVGQPVSTTTPVANADSVTTPEDTATTVISLLANDTLNGSVIVSGTATVVITANGRLGTAALNLADNTIIYTPFANVNGTDIVAYTVAVGGVTSNEGYLTVIITPVNDAPVAINDAIGAANNKAVTISVLGNDTDPDGAADLAAAVIQSLPAAGATITCNGGVAATVGTACSGGLITFTPTAQGAFSFTYKAQDQAGLVSLNTANVSVAVTGTENIVVTKSIFTAKTWRWTVSGTDNVPSGQTLTIKYDITTPPTYKVGGVCTAMTAATNPVIGTAPVDALGNWAYDVLGTSAGLTNPTNTGSNGTGFWCSPPKAVRVTSPLGGTANSNISLK